MSRGRAPKKALARIRDSEERRDAAALARRPTDTTPPHCPVHAVPMHLSLWSRTPVVEYVPGWLWTCVVDAEKGVHGGACVEEKRITP